MPLSDWFVKVARLAPIVSLGLGLLVAVGCSPPELGSVKLPVDLKRSGPMGYGPASSKGASPSLGPGDFRPAPPARAKANSRGGRPSGSRTR
jgi:hypothetical protein